MPSRITHGAAVAGSAPVIGPARPEEDQKWLRSVALGLRILVLSTPIYFALSLGVHAFYLVSHFALRRLQSTSGGSVYRAIARIDVYVIPVIGIIALVGLWFLTVKEPRRWRNRASGWRRSAIRSGALIAILCEFGFIALVYPPQALWPQLFPWLLQIQKLACVASVVGLVGFAWSFPYRIANHPPVFDWRHLIVFVLYCFVAVAVIDAIVASPLAPRWLLKLPVHYLLRIAGDLLLLCVIPFLIWLRQSASQGELGTCPCCRYDLRGTVRNGCPECGWGRKLESAMVE